MVGEDACVLSEMGNYFRTLKWNLIKIKANLVRSMFDRLLEQLYKSIKAQGGWELALSEGLAGCVAIKGISIIWILLKM